MRPSCTLKFQFVFGFNQSLWGIFSLLNFENVWFYIWVLVVWFLILRQKWLQVTSYPCRWIKKIECKDHRIYPKMLRKIFQNEVYSQFHSHKTFIFWSTFSIYMVQTFPKSLWWWFLVPRSEPLSISSTTLSSCITWTFSMLVGINNFFLRSFSLMCCLVAWSVQFINQGFKCFLA